MMEHGREGSRCRGPQRARAVPMLVVVAAALMGCSGGGENPPATTLIAEPADDAPQVCTELASDESLAGLAGALRAVASDEAEPDVENATEKLRAVADDFSAATAAADALEAWAAGPDEPATTEQLATAFNALDEEIQAKCGFPLS
jgi:hypothetical protein